MSDRTCSVPACDTKAHTRGWCGAHYSRWRKYGDVQEHIPVTRWGKAPDPCSVDGCDRPTIAKGMCNPHYARVRYFGGDPLPGKPFKGEHVPGKAWCHGHEKLLPLDLFYKNPSRGAGVDSYCRDCKNRLLRTKYSEGVKRSSKRWREANADKMRDYKRKYVEAFPERRRQSTVTYSLNRRTRLVENGGTATVEQIRARWAYYGDKCWICRAPADSTDHVKPVSRGGSGWPANLRPICRPCNSRKNNTWPYAVEVPGGNHEPEPESEAGPVPPVALD